jgi:magnesium transporter
MQLLHLHPLTLEDILHRDPREKLELFPKLGYYFVVFRAIGTREHFQHKDSMEYDDNFSTEGMTIGDAIMYLVVFRRGICTVSDFSHRRLQ